MDLFVIRHAQSTNNALADQRDRVYDPPLTALGWRQAELLAAHLSTGLNRDPRWGGDPAETNHLGQPGYSISRLYTSAMRRSLQTATPLGRALGLRPQVWLDIHEQGGLWLDQGNPHGVRGFPGITRSELAAEFPDFDAPEELTEEGWWRGGREDEAAAAQRAARVADTLRRWAIEGRDERIAIITHGAFSDLLFRNLLGQPATCPVYYLLNNASLSLFRLRPNGDVSVRYLNRVDHLPLEMIS